MRGQGEPRKTDSKVSPYRATRVRNIRWFRVVNRPQVANLNVQSVVTVTNQRALNMSTKAKKVNTSFRTCLVIQGDRDLFAADFDHDRLTSRYGNSSRDRRIQTKHRYAKPAGKGTGRILD